MNRRIRPEDDRSFKGSPERAELQRIYAEVDVLVSSITCDVSTDCCHFERTGKEPYLTAVEYAELHLAGRASGMRAPTSRPTRPKNLPIASEGKCPFLSDAGRCRVYASRPIGCRTFFCERASGQAPRREIADLLRRIVDLSEGGFEEGRAGRPLRSWVEAR